MKVHCIDDRESAAVSQAPCVVTVGESAVHCSKQKKNSETRLVKTISQQHMETHVKIIICNTTGLKHPYGHADDSACISRE